MLDQDFTEYLQNEAGQYFGNSFKIQDISTIHGGSISSSYRLDSNLGSFFMKCNESKKFPGMFRIEQESLNKIRETETLAVPKVYLQGEFNQQAYLFMEFIPRESESDNFWEAFGEQLANMHRIQSEKFGYPDDNYIGSLPQKNSFCDNWLTFFTEHRLLDQARLAYQASLISQSLMSQIERLCASMEGMFPTEKASFIHGDLWSGNFICGPGSKPYLIDPAIYYGNREMDIAMSHLFGGFKPRFYESYNANFPLLPGWQERIDLCNLYPLLVHVNLFGSSYASRVKNIVQKYS